MGEGEDPRYVCALPTSSQKACVSRSKSSESTPLPSHSRTIPKASTCILAELQHRPARWIELTNNDQGRPISQLHDSQYLQLTSPPSCSDRSRESWLPRTNISLSALQKRKSAYSSSSQAAGSFSAGSRLSTLMRQKALMNRFPIAGKLIPANIGGE